MSLMLLREKWWCYKSAEPYTLGHVCKSAHMHFILTNEHEGIDEGQREDNEEFFDCPEGELSNKNIEVSIHALAGGNEHKTIKMKGTMGGKRVLILADSGSTHCFVDERLVVAL